MPPVLNRRRQVLLALATALLGQHCASLAATRKQLIQARVRRGDWRVYRELMAWAVELDPSEPSIRAVAREGMLDTAVQAVPHTWPVQRASCLIAIATESPAMAVGARLELLRQAFQLAAPSELSVPLGAANLVAVALAFGRLGAEADARRSIDAALAHLAHATRSDNASALWNMARGFASAEGHVPDWMWAAVANRLPSIAERYEQAHAYLVIAEMHGRAGRHDAFLRYLAHAESAAAEVPDERRRRIVTDSIARSAVNHDELAQGLRIGGANAIGHELAVYYARAGQRAKALDAQARLPEGGLYDSPRGAAAEAIVNQALQSKRADDADFYFNAFSESLTVSRTAALAGLVDLQSDQRSPAFDRRARELVELVDSTTPSPYTSGRDVEALLVVARTLRRCGMPKAADSALTLAARHLLYMVRRGSVERAVTTAKLAEALAEQGKHPDAIEHTLRATDLAIAQPVSTQTERKEKAELLLAIVPALRTFARTKARVTAWPAAPRPAG